MTKDSVLATHRNVFYQALLTQNWPALAKLYADDYTLVRANGSVLNKEEVLYDLKSGGLTFTSIELTQEAVRLCGSAAILTGESQTVARRGEASFASRFRLVAVYVEVEGVIQLLHFQSTNIATAGSSPAAIAAKPTTAFAAGTHEQSAPVLPFTGVWSLEAFTESSGSSAVSYPLGQDPAGFLIYTTDGYVSAQLMQANRPSLKSEPWDARVSTQGADLTKGYISYCGRYTVRQEISEVIHLPIVALVPNLIDRAQRRSYRFAGDTLTLSTTRVSAEGQTIVSTLLWRRTSQVADRSKSS